MSNKNDTRLRRKYRIRAKIHGTAERPRLTVFRSSKHIYAQVVNDDAGTTVAFASTLSKDVRDAVKEDRKVDAAKKVGEAIAKACVAAGVTQVVFDRNGYVYQAQNRIGVLADAARKAGLSF
ncbi:MAG: 50S ribosomal protein L18 [Polyangiales bacterium]